MYDVSQNAFFSLKTEEKFNPKWYQGEPVSESEKICSKVQNFLFSWSLKKTMAVTQATAGNAEQRFHNIFHVLSLHTLILFRKPNVKSQVGVYVRNLIILYRRESPPPIVLDVIMDSACVNVLNTASWACLGFVAPILKREAS